MGKCMNCGNETSDYLFSNEIDREKDGDVPGRIIAAQRIDATENNIEILKSIVRGEKPDGRKIDEFKPGSTQKALNEVMSLADAVMID